MQLTTHNLWHSQGGIFAIVILEFHWGNGVIGLILLNLAIELER